MIAIALQGGWRIMTMLPIRPIQNMNDNDLQPCPT